MKPDKTSDAHASAETMTGEQRLARFEKLLRKKENELSAEEKAFLQSLSETATAEEAEFIRNKLEWKKRREQAAWQMRPVVLIFAYCLPIIACFLIGDFICGVSLNRLLVKHWLELAFGLSILLFGVIWLIVRHIGMTLSKAALCLFYLLVMLAPVADQLPRNSSFRSFLVVFLSLCFIAVPVLLITAVVLRVRKNKNKPQ